MANTSQKRYLILDTNIIQYAGSKPLERSKKIVDFLIGNMQQDLKIAISNITVFEAIQRCSETKEKEVLQKLDLFTQLEVSREALIVAGWLADIYRRENIPDSQISDCDRIIAATAILTNSLIFTANGNDFPRPIFNEKNKRLIHYADKGRDHMIVVYVLEPDIEAFKDKFSKRPKN